MKSRPWLRLNYSIINRSPYDLHPAGNIPFLHDVAHVRLYGVLTTAQAGADFLGRKAFEKKREDFFFPDGKHSGVCFLFLMNRCP
jgi:hypothetical protein